MKFPFDFIFSMIFLTIGIEAKFTKYSKADILTSSWFSRTTRGGIRSFSFCASICESSNDCTAFTYYQDSSVCQLGLKGKSIPKTSSLQQSTLVYEIEGDYKILVVTGYPITGISNTVEIVDLESSSSICPNPPVYPHVLYYPMGVFGFQNMPIFCGGFNGASMFGDCFLLDNGAWKTSFPMVYAKFAAGLTLSPFSNSSQILFMTGGETSEYQGIITNEVLTPTGWELFKPSLPVTVTRHCMLLWDSSTAIIVGGIQGGKNGVKTFLISDSNRSWVEGPSNKIARNAHACARIRQDNRSPKLSIIIAGGWASTGGLSSVEILDEGSLAWRDGTNLPLTTWTVNLVEDPRGGVILVGGYNGIEPTTSLYRLEHVGFNVNWQLLPQKLKVGNRWMRPIIIPDRFASNCTSP